MENKNWKWKMTNVFLSLIDFPFLNCFSLFVNNFQFVFRRWWFPSPLKYVLLWLLPSTYSIHIPIEAMKTLHSCCEVINISAFSVVSKLKNYSTCFGRWSKRFKIFVFLRVCRHFNMKASNMPRSTFRLIIYFRNL